MKIEPYSDFLLEAYVSGDLADEQSKALERDLETDALLKERVEAIISSNESFLSRHPAKGAWTEVERRLKMDSSVKARDRRKPSLTKLVLSFGGAFCALAIFALSPSTDQATSESEFRTKGALPHLDCLLYTSDAADE